MPSPSKSKTAEPVLPEEASFVVACQLTEQSD
jgi:hypothetical protein